MKSVFEAGYLNPAEGNVRSSQLLALLIIIVGIVLIIVRRQLGLAKQRYTDPLVNHKVPVVIVADPADGAITPITTERAEQKEALEEETETTENDGEKEDPGRPI
jgi:phosphatidylglycerol:prolipoprotein diacylglycerol transferase